MAFGLFDRVQDTTTTTGTGSLALAGAPPSGYRSFSSVLSTNDYTHYSIFDPATGAWEEGLGQLTGATTLARTAVSASSNSNALVSFAAGTKYVWIDALPMDMAGSDLMHFGAGSDGNLTISSGTTSLSTDTYYKNVTLSGTAVLNLAGYRLFISEVLDISAAPAGAIISTVTAGGAGANAGTAGTAGTGVTGVTVGGSGSGTAGGAGGTGAGAQATAPTNQTPANGGAGGASGAGGSGSGGAGGAQRTGATVASALPFPRWGVDLLFGVTALVGGAGGAGGGSGGGDGAVNGGGGGGGGAGGPILFISARAINRGSSSTAGIIDASGKVGGAGGSPASGNAGGGGGGSGGGGGWVYLAYQFLYGSTITNAIAVDGAAGGAGGNGIGTGVGGDGGGSGSSGRVTLVNIGAGTSTEPKTPVAGAAGTAHSGVSGGAGHVVNTSRTDL